MRHNTVVMMEMQDTINELQRELTALGKASSRSRPPSEGVGQQVKTLSLSLSLYAAQHEFKETVVCLITPA